MQQQQNQYFQENQSIRKPLVILLHKTNNSQDKTENKCNTHDKLQHEH